MTNSKFNVALALIMIACSSTATETPEQVSLNFESFVKKTYPGGEFKNRKDGDRVVNGSCRFAHMEVVKTDSASSPYKGILNGESNYTNAAIPNDSLTTFRFNLIFWRKGGTWKCEDSQSRGIGVINLSGGKPLETSLNDPCTMLAYCTPG